jgi:hypothetical protein
LKESLDEIIAELPKNTNIIVSATTGTIKQWFRTTWIKM